MSRNDNLPLGRLILTHRYGAYFLTPFEFSKQWRLTKVVYYRQLARALIELRGTEYWRFQRDGLQSEGLTIDRKCLAWGIVLEIVDILGNPKRSLGRLLRGVRAR